MAKKVVNKKLVVTTNFDHLTELALGSAFSKLQSNMAANPTIVPGINPTAAAVATKIAVRTALLTTRGTLQAQLKQNTEDIHTADTVLKNIFTSQWASQIQNTAGITVNQIKALAFGTKGIDDGHAASTIDDTDKTDVSAPVIVLIDRNVHNQHTLHIKNTISGKIGLPANIDRIDVYGQTGGTEPADLATLIANGGGYLGTASRGKYVNNFTSANSGSIEYYIAVYVDKTTLKPIAQSVQANAKIN